MKFYVGLHQPSHAQHFARAFISINRVRGRKKPVPSGEWILDSGAFKEIEQFGRYRHGPEEYAEEVNRLSTVNPGLIVAVSQDWMCEPFMLEKTGLGVTQHQGLTIERYAKLRGLIKDVYVMPVLQGYAPEDYVRHIWMYGRNLGVASYVGVGSVCKRNSDVSQVEVILRMIKNERPDLRLHGFGLKVTALRSAEVRDRCYSADSMAWSWAARKDGRDPNDWREAQGFAKRIEEMPVQMGMGW